jgi:hypothetical protein
LVTVEQLGGAFFSFNFKLALERDRLAQGAFTCAG